MVAPPLEAQSPCLMTGHSPRIDWIFAAFLTLRRERPPFHSKLLGPLPAPRLFGIRQ